MFSKAYRVSEALNNNVSTLCVTLGSNPQMNEKCVICQSFSVALRYLSPSSFAEQRLLCQAQLTSLQQAVKGCFVFPLTSNCNKHEGE